MLIEERAETLSKSQEFLTWNDVQKCIDMVNIQVQEEHERKKYSFLVLVTKRSMFFSFNN